MKLIGHIALCFGEAALLTGTAILLGVGSALFTRDTDAVSSASLMIDKPSGSYTVLINREKHESGSDLAAWHEFFSGGDAGVIFDDISCVTFSGDAGAFTLAESFMSRLPENQMRVSVEEAVLALSKADHGRFDVIIVSDEAAAAYGVQSVYGENVDVIRVSSEGEDR